MLLLSARSARDSSHPAPSPLATTPLQATNLNANYNQTTKPRVLWWYWKQKTRDTTHLFESSPPLLERPADLTLLFHPEHILKLKNNSILIYSHIIYLQSKRVPSSSILSLNVKISRGTFFYQAMERRYLLEMFHPQQEHPISKDINSEHQKSPIGFGRANITSTFLGGIFSLEVLCL